MPIVGDITIEYKSARRGRVIPIRSYSYLKAHEDKDCDALRRRTNMKAQGPKAD
jgi:hypothetical protein